MQCQSIEKGEQTYENTLNILTSIFFLTFNHRQIDEFFDRKH